MSISKQRVEELIKLKQIDHINMADLTKEINIHSISIKAGKNKEDK